MMDAMRFGRKVLMPSTIQIKHQLLTLWLKDQTEKEAVEAAANAGTPSDAAVRLVPQ
jgi:hypothetical protein